MACRAALNVSPPLAAGATVCDIAIIGGGASGLAAAVAAARGLQNEAIPARIAIFESTDKVGRSILRSGNGRCNFTNTNIAHFKQSDYCNVYHNGAFVCEVVQNLENALNVNDVNLLGSDSRENPKNLGRTEKHNTVLNFFESLGLLWRAEQDGRAYPLSGKASTILNLLRDAAATFGVEERVNTRITRIEPRDGVISGAGVGDSLKIAESAGAQQKCSGFILHTQDGQMIHAHKVILAAGGNVAPDILRDVVCAQRGGGNHALTYTPTAPVLAPLGVSDTRTTRALDNVRVKCSVSLLHAGREVAKERGEVLFRKYGVSGIAVFNLSRIAQPGDTLSINLLDSVVSGVVANACGAGAISNVGAGADSNVGTVANACGAGAASAASVAGSGTASATAGAPEKDAEKIIENISRNLRQFTGAPPTCSNVLRGILQEPLARAVARAASIQTESKHFDVQKLAHTLCNFNFTVTGIGDAKLAQVQRGGFGAHDLDPKTMQVRCCPGLHVTGEVIDIDAPCGGFNLHWAFVSGLLAGISCA